MSSGVAFAAVPSKDALFSHIYVNSNNSVRGTPPKDALFTNLNIGKDYSMGQPSKDLNLTHLAVTQTINAVSVENVFANPVGHV